MLRIAVSFITLGALGLLGCKTVHDARQTLHPAPEGRSKDALSSPLVGSTDISTNVYKSFYVNAEAGDDDASGEQGAPFRTLERAQAAVRLAIPSMTGNIVVFLSSHTFQLRSTLRFDAADSAKPGFKVIWSGLGPATLLSGGTVLPGTWVAHDEKKRIYKLKLNGLTPRDLFINGTRATRAKSKATFSCAKSSGAGLTTASCKLALPKTTTPVDVISLSQWMVFRCPGTLAKNAMLFIAEPCWKNSKIVYPARKATYLENNLAFLATAGQYVYDNDYLYYLAKAGELPNKLTFTTGRLSNLLLLSGASDIEFSNLGFSHSSWNDAEQNTGFLTMQSSVYYDQNFTRALIPAAFSCHACTRITVANSRFANLGNSAIELVDGSSQNLITHNTITDVGAAGIQLGGFEDADLNAPSSAHSNNTIEHNDIGYYGVTYQNAAGLLVGIADHTKVNFNNVHDGNYTGISIGWGWTDEASRNLHHNSIANNHIYNVMTTMADGAGIYMLSRSDGSTITGNYVHNVRPGNTSLGVRTFNNGLYFDQGSSFITVQNNVIKSVPTKAVFIQNVVKPFAHDITQLASTLSEAQIISGAGQ